MNSFAVQPAVGLAWRRYVDRLVDCRPALHAFCYRLIGNVWDGEDLVQDTLARGERNGASAGRRPLNRPARHWPCTAPAR
jgi:DNA-directed RNA polymerase specialized sigma24 family protein